MLVIVNFCKIQMKDGTILVNRKTYQNGKRIYANYKSKKVNVAYDEKLGMFSEI